MATKPAKLWTANIAWCDMTLGVQVRAGRCRVQVVAGQMLPGGAPHLLLILAASLPGQHFMPTPLHLFSCHVVDIAKQEAMVNL